MKIWLHVIHKKNLSPHVFPSCQTRQTRLLLPLLFFPSPLYRCYGWRDCLIHAISVDDTFVGVILVGIILVGVTLIDDMYVSVTLVGAISVSVICISIISAGVTRNGAVCILCATS